MPKPLVIQMGPDLAKCARCQNGPAPKWIQPQMIPGSNGPGPNWKLDRVRQSQMPVWGYSQLLTESRIRTWSHGITHGFGFGYSQFLMRWNKQPEGGETWRSPCANI